MITGYLIIDLQNVDLSNSVKTLNYWTKNESAYEKIESNIVRDKKQYEELKNAGWHVIIVWECELKKKQRMDTLERLVTEIQTIVETQ